MKTLKLSSLLILAVILVTSCGNPKEKKEEASTETFNLEQLIAAAEAISPNLTSMDQVYKMLDLVEAGYYPVLTNDPMKVHDYKVSYPAAAVNLGIYLTDIVYHGYGDDVEKQFLTFGAAQELAKYLGMESDFARLTIETFELDNIPRDSMALILNDLLRDSEIFESEEELLFVNTAIITGSFIQKTYISGSLIQQALKAEELSPSDEANLKELIVIFSNQLIAGEPLLKSIDAQKENIQSSLLRDEFASLMQNAREIESAKAAILAEPLEELSKDPKLKNAFESITKIRTNFISSN